MTATVAPAVDEIPRAVEATVITATGTAIPPKMSAAELMASEGMTIKQNFKDCARICLCQPNWQWTVHGYSPGYTEGQEFPTVMFLQEDSPQCPNRSFSWYAPGCRETKYHVYEGADANGTKIMEHSKGMTCGVTDYPFRADSPEEASAWVGILTKRMATASA